MIKANITIEIYQLLKQFLSKLNSFFINLISNALEYSKEEGILQVSITTNRNYRKRNARLQNR
jgi:signal transduction histidine kinase